MRLIIDYRQCNQNIEPINYPHPTLEKFSEHFAAKCSGKEVFMSSIDLISGYYQVKIREQDRGITAFATEHQKFQFRRSPFGLKTSGVKSNQILSQIFSDLIVENKVFIYVDDFLIITATFQEHLEILKIIFERMAEYNITMSVKKSMFFMTRLNFLVTISQGAVYQ